MLTATTGKHVPEPERGKFVEVLRSYSTEDKRTRWQRGLIVGVGPGVFTELGGKYTLSENEILVKLSNGHAMRETIVTIDRRYTDTWRLLFR